ncbi:hypothetical protein ABT160_43275 [Streptomyces sp. NPDC001941]|uniref:hypothetical protein n=1 Tax=Streptomyces sp. NPDC001941 TaxID=3154659 RepID=UPI00332DD4B8
MTARWWPALVALVATGFLALQLPLAPGRATPDTTNYAAMALTGLGTPYESVRAQAVEQRCADGLRRERERRALDIAPAPGREPLDEWGVTGACEERVTAALPVGLMGAPGGPAPTRCERIFQARPGYSWAVTPFVAALGLRWGMWTYALLVTVTGGVLAYALLRVTGLAPPAALAGQLLYYALPTGSWSMRPLTEGTVLTLTLAVLLGVALLLTGRTRLGPAVLAGATAALFAVKYSAATTTAAACAAGCALLLLTGRARRAPAALALTGSLALGCALGARLLGWPGPLISLMELFSDHCRGQDVPDPWQRLFALNGPYWTAWWRTQATEPLGLLAWAAGAWGLLARPARHPLGPVVLAVAATGLLTQALHPDVLEGDRLHLALWLLPVLGLPRLLHRARHPLGPAKVTPAPLTG